MSKLNDTMNEYANELIEQYTDPDELLKEVTAFYLAILSTFGISAAELTLGEAKLVVSGIASLELDAVDNSKPILELVH